MSISGPKADGPAGLPAPLEGPDCRVEFEAAPGGLQDAVLIRAIGSYDGPMMVQVYRALAAALSGEVMNLLCDTRAAETFMDYASFDEASRHLVDRGYRRLNVVVCDRDAGRGFVVRLGNAVSSINGLAVDGRIAPSLPEAIDVLAGLMQGGQKA